MGHLYRAIDEHLSQITGSQAGFRELLRFGIPVVPEAAHDVLRNNATILREFFVGALRIFREALDGQRSPSILRLLLGDSPLSWGEEFHRGLPDRVWRAPVFFRTDESATGKVFEIQCPGSGWGDIDLLKWAAKTAGFDSSCVAPLAPEVANGIRLATNRPQPTVLHLLDNSSNPVSMRYMMALTRPHVRYWGLDDGVRNRTCDFVRSHSFAGLVSENLFRDRLAEAAAGEVTFDLPPIAILDEKMILCLPFLTETRDEFADPIRHLLSYSTPVLEDGFCDTDGSFVSLDEFAKRPKAQRRYVVKYAGVDTTLNWGARGVSRLCEEDGAERLAMAARDARRGRFWLVQPEERCKEPVVYLPRESEEPLEAVLTAKRSCFYGPIGLLAVRTMHRKHYKVHGSDSTVVGVLGTPHR